MAFHTVWLFLDCERPPTPVYPADAPDITYTPRPASYQFASNFRNRAAGQFLSDNGAGDYGRTEADDLALVQLARDAGFSVNIA